MSVSLFLGDTSTKLEHFMQLKVCSISKEEKVMTFQYVRFFLLLVFLTVGQILAGHAATSCVKSASKFMRPEKHYLPLKTIMDDTPANQQYDELAKLLKYRSKLKNIGGKSDGLYKAYGSRADDVSKLTAEILSQPIKTSSSRKSSLSKAEAETIYQSLRSNNVASTISSDIYANEIGGGCFTRASFIHFELNLRNFSHYNTRKIWAVGELNNGMWNYHVATIVPNVDGGWWVMDSFTGVVDSKEWMKQIKEYDTKGDLMFILSPAERLGPGRFYYEVPRSSKIPKDSPLNNFPTFYKDLLNSYDQRGWKAFSGEVF